MIEKRVATLAVCAVLLFCVFTAGCSGPTASPTPSNAKNSSTNTTSAQAAASAKATNPSASVSNPSATLTPSALQTPSNTPAVAGPASLSVLFFYRPECPYCQALENTTSFQQLQTKVPVQWIVSDQSPLTGQYNAGTVPMLILLNHGTEVARSSDATPILTQVNSLLGTG